MKKILIGVVIAALLIVGGFAIASSNSDNAKPNNVQPVTTEPSPVQPTPTQPAPPVQPTPNEPAVLELTVEQLIKNALASPKRYEGKTIQVRGIVAEIQVGTSGSAVIFAPEVMGYHVSVDNKLADYKNFVSLTNLDIGSEVVLQGEFDGIWGKIVLLENGTVIKKP